MTMLDASPPIGGLSPIHEGIHPRRELRQRPILGPAGVLIARLSIVSRIRQICFGICGWRNWRRVRDLDDPAGYLYRIRHRAALRLAKKRPHPPSPPPQPPHSPDSEPGLGNALARLSERQRAVVVLVRGYGLSQRGAAKVLDLSQGTLQRHLDRGLRRLRLEPGVMSARPLPCEEGWGISLTWGYGQ